MQFQELPGLSRLMATCQTLQIGLVTGPPARQPPAAGTRVLGQLLDPLLVAVYHRLGQAAFATEAAGLVLFRWDDQVNDLEVRNRWFQESAQPRLALPLLEFAGESFLAYSYATVPDLADEHGRQPVVMVDGYEEPSALPVASDVDTFLGTYASYLQVLVAHPEFEAPMECPVVFPWHVPEIVARDERLVALLRAGRFDPFLRNKELRDWAATLLRIADSRP